MQNGRIPSGSIGKCVRMQKTGKKERHAMLSAGPGVVSRTESINVSANIVYVIQGELFTQDST